ncbi:MAG: hypothetical protein ACXAAO_07550, partial [Candidatus Thorarchaeota archaeon]
MQSELDLGSLIIGNLVFSFYMTPMVLIGASVFRGLLLLSGQKREFEDWTRNKLMTILSIIFLPGSLVFIGIRLLIVRIFRVTIEDIGSS